MDISGHTMLVTGGGSGIGFALAERFLEAGNTVIICGRRTDKLEEAHGKHRALRTHACDVADPEHRVELTEWAFSEFPELDVLINNAGIQNRLQLVENPGWPAMHKEIATNLEAPIHLSTLFAPRLAKRPNAAIINVTSGLAFVPRSAVPVYCATKAAMRSFTLSLRHQLVGTSVEVLEIIPPAVDTDLGGVGLHTFGVPLEDFADSAFEQLREGKREVTYGFSVQSMNASAEDREALFAQMNSQ